MDLREEFALDRTYLAEERTILAYIRTGIASICLGFVILKFFREDFTLYGQNLALVIGSLLILTGVFLIIVRLPGLFKERSARRCLERDLIARECESSLGKDI